MSWGADPQDQRIMREQANRSCGSGAVAGSMTVMYEVGEGKLVWEIRGDARLG